MGCAVAENTEVTHFCDLKLFQFADAVLRPNLQYMRERGRGERERVKYGC
jgi:hypothetical protein